MKSNRKKTDRVNRTQALTHGETLTLAAIAERIFPATESPGAVDIGALEYIRRALAGDYQTCLPDYRRGLKAVNRYARETFGARFEALSDNRKDAVLADFEAGSVAAFKKAAEFFEMIRRHVLEGVFGEPRYGGNRGLIGWRLVGFPGQRYGYSDAYIDKRVDLSPLAAEQPRREED